MGTLYYWDTTRLRSQAYFHSTHRADKA